MESALKNIYDEVSEENKIGTDEMLHRMEENTRRVGQWARQLRELAARGMSEGLLNELKDMGPQAADKVDAFARMTSDQLERANQIFAAKSALPDYATDKIIESYKEAGFNASLGFKEGVDTTAANDTMIKLGDEACESLKGELQEKSPSKRTKQMGQWAVEGLDEGIKDGHLRSRILLDIKLLTNYIMKEFEKGLDKTKMQTIALNCLKGFVDGLLKYKTVVASTIGTVASDILKSFANVFKIHSPSRVMMEMGEYMMLGFGLGMEDGTSYVEKQTGSTANDILNSMKENLKLIEGVDEQGVYQPVIRPVLDMSLVESGYLGFQDYLNNTNPLTGISLAGNLSRLTPTTTDDAPTVEYDILDAINAMDINGIRNEMTMLRNDISDLQQAMTNMQVVMDTGALVGQLVNPLDNALGNKALYNGRGRY